MLKYRNLKKTAAALLTACLISTTICSCGGTAGATDTESTDTSDVEKADIPYTEKEIPVFREKLTDEKVPLRFYEDQPNVPYMGIAAYYTMMIPNAEMTVERYEDGSYFLYHENGNAVIDINEETMSSDNISDFGLTESIPHLFYCETYSNDMIDLHVAILEENVPVVSTYEGMSVSEQFGILSIQVLFSLFILILNLGSHSSHISAFLHLSH